MGGLGGVGLGKKKGRTVERVGGNFFPHKGGVPSKNWRGNGERACDNSIEEGGEVG